MIDSPESSESAASAMADVAENREHLIRVGAEDAGQRLDRFLSERIDGLSRSRLKSLIEDGRVRAGAATIAEASSRVKPGMLLTVEIPPAAEAEPAPQDIPLDVVFEDEHLIVIDKPAGLVVHPAAGNLDGTLVNALIHHCGDSLSGIGGVKRPGIVHRLDKDTSGLMVAAKSDAAHQGLAELFAAHDIERAYQALVWGRVGQASGEIEGNIGRDPRNRKKMAVLKSGGKAALTRYRRLECFFDALSLVECRLATGRTHQIRVHMTSIGHGLVGDPVYGRPRRGRVSALPEETRATVEAFPRQALHAGLLGFRHPVTGETLRFEKESPYDLQRLLEALRRAARP